MYELWRDIGGGFKTEGYYHSGLTLENRKRISRSRKLEKFGAF